MPEESEEIKDRHRSPALPFWALATAMQLVLGCFFLLQTLKARGEAAFEFPAMGWFPLRGCFTESLILCTQDNPVSLSALSSPLSFRGAQGSPKLCLLGLGE